ncbi:hypothetical protein [Pseudomonas yamanorum]|uniref:hypothetical protein n=1 Tax=Pseudomonas yamanorum TaxID=515393 RepID=UPI002ED0104E|nr:hypothetical protein VYI69_13695 [Pseudomonas yamanorum]
MWEWIVLNNGVLALIVAVIVAVSALVQYFAIKLAEERARKFADFHQLLQDLNEGKPKPDGSVGGQYIDRQVAIIFELRSFKKYHPVILRILKRSIPTWSSPDNSYLNPLFIEAQKTIDHIKAKQHRRFLGCRDLEE